MLEKVIVALFGLVSSYYLTYLCVKYFPKLNHLMDTPSARKKHKNVTPTSGGIVIALLLITLSILYYLYSHDPYILYFIIALITLSFISFLDDIKHLGVLIRLPFHFLTAWLTLKSLGVIQVPQLYFIPQNILDFLMLIGDRKSVV
jgi:UDP-N-acetylmuramyl pentapeptide phosphotransferase/UDP-N-acetylglucosamine-1-phosphate transferase